MHLVASSCVHVYLCMCDQKYFFSALVVINHRQMLAVDIASHGSSTRSVLL